MRETDYHERLLKLEGAILGLQSVNEVILNHFTQVGTADRVDAIRRDLKRILVKILETTTFDVLPMYTPDERNMVQEGFRDAIANASNKIFLLDLGESTVTHERQVQKA